VVSALQMEADLAAVLRCSLPSRARLQL